MVSFKVLLPLTLAAVGAIAKSATHDALVSISGSVETWDSIRAIEVDPTATFEGNPVNYSLIIAYQPPKATPESKRTEAQALLDLKEETKEVKLMKAESMSRYISGNWVW